MNILIFKTDISNQEKINQLKLIFINQFEIFKWSVDIEDIDNILRIESSNKIDEIFIVDLLTIYRFYCEVLEI
tara:strand:+ start:4452 stop:4670 length:219 start_codon:yes stop_codon:yes gene_type:complete